MSATPSIPVFRFDPLREEDLVMLRGWLLRSHVADWWGPAESIDELRESYIAGVEQRSTTRAYIVRVDERPIGFIQSYVVMGSGGGWWENETDPGARGTDQFLAEPGDLNRGIGSAMLRVFVDRLFEDPSITVVQTDPDPLNTRAIRCYARAGFVSAGMVETPDGPALLMRCYPSRDSSSRPYPG